MRPQRRLGVVGLIASGALAASMLMPAAATARPNTPRPLPGAQGDHSSVGPDYNFGKKLPIAKSDIRAVKRKISTSSAQRTAAGDYEVGDVQYWVALDDTSGPYLKKYTLRGIGNNIEVWVANNTAFPAGDCRNTLGLTAVTQDQVDNFVSEFDTNIYPKESAAFSTPPALDGTDAPLGDMLGDPTMYQVTAAQADDTVVLVDNVRDANFYDPTSPDGQTFIAGFFYSYFNFLSNRNIMTIDAYDWLHRTGANPPDDSADPAYQACAAELNYGRGLGVPRARDYEGTFAHEYQHLLESYASPGEASWVNEGLSDYAQTLVGYVDTALPPTDPNFDSHIGCFEGFLPESYGGAENSLTLWEDQGGPEVLCDYGAAYTFMQYVRNQFGARFMSKLHNQDLNGMEGFNKVLKSIGSTRTAMSVIKDWSAAMALDAVLDKGSTLTGGAKRRFSAKSLNGQILWTNPQSYNSAGAPPNGSDYVRVRDAAGVYLKASKLKSLSFVGTKVLEPDPVEWVSVTDAPDATTASTTCGAVETGTVTALYSGCGANLDRSIVQKVTIPAAGGQLSFDALWDAEELWDYGVVQVSTDNGVTWTSLATEDTTTDHDPDAQALAVDNLPGLTGDSGTWKTEHADLSAYAGKTVLLSFRYITDGGVDEGGFWVKNVDVAGTALATDSIDAWKTLTQIAPIKVKGYTVQLVGYTATGKAHIKRLTLDSNFFGSMGRAALLKAVGRSATTVAVLVMQNDPTETRTKYADYHLVVNGVKQPGGGNSPARVG